MTAVRLKTISDVTDTFCTQNLMRNSSGAKIPKIQPPFVISPEQHEIYTSRQPNQDRAYFDSISVRNVKIFEKLR